MGLPGARVKLSTYAPGVDRPRLWVRMKIQLTHKGNVAILRISGELPVDKIPALKAGVSKHLRSGRNKIAIFLAGDARLPKEAWAELGALHALAAELKGSLIVSGGGPEAAEAARRTGDKDPLRFFETEDLAFGFLSGKPADAPVTVAAETTAKLKALEGEVTTLKGRLANSDAEVTKKLRGENGRLQERVTALEEELRTLVRDRGKPIEADGLHRRIGELEAALAEATTARAAPASAAGPPAPAAPAKPAATAAPAAPAAQPKK